DVDVGEEVLPHVAPVAVRAVGRHRVVLVEVERRHRREVDFPRPVPPDQFAVDPQRGAPGGEPEHAAALGRYFAPDRVDDPLGEEGGEIVVVGNHERTDALPLARALDRDLGNRPRRSWRIGGHTGRIRQPTTTRQTGSAPAVACRNRTDIAYVDTRPPYACRRRPAEPP